MGIIKSGKVVIVLSGKYAGRKAVVAKTYDDGSADRKFNHAIVVGIDRYPRKVTKKMSKTKVTKRSKMKPFIKAMNYNHLMPTRYSVDMDLKKIVEENSIKEGRMETRKSVKKIFEERYLNQASFKSEKKATGVQYFFKKLRF
mmetsp:Transcript_7316/g.10999  ORF Transcript_7316/g.10999 Transcript_7316/m.10999 type:complete len:143 (-) Transcript_7316:110-538(-)|eukprot:CAMPEP_0113936038 /NCGR_PEP_ID=MMETSP1339-20121228/3028_1 /TAXON_ID=94617 /ORGANISM="Fibrocapsa japonica" /LENGTH=142 /DNA_ID=CAMNT_0000938375 /DNA_START=106 /DNA_END=534 /DNA_ORIENTATION=- /assembly_acc=CAM_ASM_000762